MTPDFGFYLVAIPAVTLVGLSKGGMGEALSLMGVPLLAMAVSPVQAAAIMLPVLIFMDWVALWIWRKHNSMAVLKIMLPGALAGILVGYLTASMVPQSLLKLVIGGTTILFALRYFYGRLQARAGVAERIRGHDPVRASAWGLLSGYTSFVSHAGGPPFQIYTLPLGLDPKDFTGTAVRFFAVLNAVKLVPYAALGQLDMQNFWVSMTLLPFVPLATIAGAWVVRRMKKETYYPFMYVMALLTGLKLFWTGLVG